LYEAQRPEFRVQIYIIILDEMNLSRPEQYFADFLSKLEQDAPELILNTDLERPSPQLFKKNDTLIIPPNVWFVGTANQDETTLEFADKTYDRAHVMELERS
jgi:5-methylcytosine-specific restriction endonuclease McrBC GTP-binding regulatory subunit McrB